MPVVNKVSVTGEEETKGMKDLEEEMKAAVNSAIEIAVTEMKEEKDQQVADVADLEEVEIVVAEAADLVDPEEELLAVAEVVAHVKNRPEIEGREVVKKRTFAPLFEKVTITVKN